VSYHPDGVISAVTPTHPNAAFPVVKRIAGQLPPPVTRFLVPSIDVVQNRVAVEIMRGCTRGCRFCQAGMISRPVRERPVEEIVAAIEQACRIPVTRNALLSLSSSTSPIYRSCRGSHPLLFQSAAVRNTPFAAHRFLSIELMDRLKGPAPRGGFTLLRAATERMPNYQ
jgi:hypothetical protein